MFHAFLCFRLFLNVCCVFVACARFFVGLEQFLYCILSVSTMRKTNGAETINDNENDDNERHNTNNINKNDKNSNNNKHTENIFDVFSLIRLCRVWVRAGLGVGFGRVGLGVVPSLLLRCVIHFDGPN